MASRLTRWSLLTTLAIAGMTIGSLPPAEAPIGDLVLSMQDGYYREGRDPLQFARHATRTAIGVTQEELTVAQREAALATFGKDRRPVLVVSYRDGGKAAVDAAKTAEAAARWSAITPAASAPRSLLVAVDWARINGAITTTTAGNVCVAYLRYGQRWFDPGPRIPASAGGCYLSTEFGVPGGWWRKWLASVGEVEIPRPNLYAQRPIEVVRPYASTWVELPGPMADNTIPWWISTAAEACAAGRTELCGSVFGAASDSALSDPSWGVYTSGRARLVPRLPAALLTDLGPDRFREVWTSDAPLVQSYQRVTGRPFDEWAQEYVQRAVGRLDKENALSAAGWLGWALWMVLLFAWLGARINAKEAA